MVGRLSDINEFFFYPPFSLEVTLQKRSEGTMWPELVMGDKRGEYIISNEQAALIHERLSYLTSEDLVRLLSTFILQMLDDYHHSLWCTVADRDQWPNAANDEQMQQK